jgi:hypothetical protein
MRSGADGIALSCDFSTLYFCPLSSQTLFGIPTLYLRNAFEDPSSVPEKVRQKEWRRG